MPNICKIFSCHEFHILLILYRKFALTLNACNTSMCTQEKRKIRLETDCICFNQFIHEKQRSSQTKHIKHLHLGHVFDQAVPPFHLDKRTKQPFNNSLD